MNGINSCAISYSLVIFFIEEKLLLIMVGIIPVLYIISRKTAKYQRVFAVKNQENEASCMGFTQRSFLGIDNIKAYQGEEREIADFSNLNADIFTVHKRSSINMGFFHTQESVLMSFGTVSVKEHYRTNLKSLF